MDLLRALLQGRIDEGGYVKLFKAHLANGGYPVRHRRDTEASLRECGFVVRSGSGRGRGGGHGDAEMDLRILWDYCYADTVARPERESDLAAAPMA